MNFLFVVFFLEVSLTNIESKLKENLKLCCHCIHDTTSVWAPVNDTDFIFVHRPQDCLSDFI